MSVQEIEDLLSTDEDVSGAFALDELFGGDNGDVALGLEDFDDDVLSDLV